MSVRIEQRAKCRPYRKHTALNSVKRNMARIIWRRPIESGKAPGRIFQAGFMASKAPACRSQERSPRNWRHFVLDSCNLMSWVEDKVVDGGSLMIMRCGAARLARA